MPTERVQRRLDALLDEAETALTARDWATVAARCEAVLALDPENADAAAYREAAGRGVAQATGSVDLARSGPSPAIIMPVPTLPPSFAGGRYAVRRFLGEGGRKRVYLAHDTRLDREVAFCTIRAEGLDDTGRERVLREAQSVARLGQHPNLVTVHDIGEDGGNPYIVQEYMSGGDVASLLQAAKDERLPVVRTLALAKDVCRGLSFIHAGGLVHRDLKPQNVFLGADGSARIGDFGLAVALDRSRITQYGLMMGTVAYMPPEQALGGESTPKADLYSLGAMLYEMITGRPPFIGDNPTAVISQHINTPPVAPSWVTDHCPPALEEIILHLLSKDPAKRPASAAEVLAALEKVDPEAKSASHSDSNVLDRLARGVFVGREKELERLRKAFDEAFSGRGSVVMLVGEPGIGKTRTTQELETYARMRGARVLWGRAHEASGAPSYYPWKQIGDMHARFVAPAEIAADLDPGQGAELARIFPVLGGQPPEVRDAASAQFRLFDAFTAFLRSGANRAPLLIVLDDLHWADQPSLLLLQHLARELGRLRILVVGTFRDTDLSRAHPLSQALAELNRESGTQRVVLRGLSEKEVGAYIRAVSPKATAPGLVRRIYEETEGNPFFLAEVVNLMVQEGTLHAGSVSDIAIPDGVREAIGRRLNLISDEANELLTTAAVVGREFPFDTLALLYKGDSAALVRLINEGLKARVIEELEQPGRYQFTHAQMQETLLSEISTTSRVHLNGQIAEALEERYGDRAKERAARLAQHFFESATLTERHATKAVQYAMLAAQTAESQSAWADGAKHYEHCLTMMAGAETAFGADEAELLTRLGACQLNMNAQRPAWRSLMRAITLYRERGDGVGLATASLQALGIEAPPERRKALAEAALAAILGLDEPRLEGRLHAEFQADGGGAFASPEVVLVHLRRLAEIVDATGDHELEALLMAMRASSMEDMSGRSDGCLAAHRRFVVLGMSGQAARYGLEAMTLAMWAGQLDRALAIADEVTRYAAAHGQRFFEENIANFRSLALLVRGRLMEYDNLVASRPNDRTWFTAIVQAWRDELASNLQGAIASLPDPSAAIGQAAQHAYVHAVRARVLANSAHRDAAAAEFRLMRGFYAQVTGTPQDRWFAENILCLLDEAFSFVADADFRSMVRTRLSEGTLEGYGFDPISGRSVRRVFGDRALELGLDATAEASYAQALELAVSQRAVVEEGRTRLGLANLSAGKGKIAEAMEQLDRAAAIFRDCGAKLYFDWVIAKKVELQGITSSDSSIIGVSTAVGVERPNLSTFAAPDGAVTLMFTDIESSTALTAQLGDARWIAILREHNRAIEDAVRNCGGRVVKNRGDGYMLVFAQPQAALDCAVAIQRHFAGHDTVRVRIGIHTGNPVREGADFFGNDVNFAARVADKALGGQILVSARVHDALGGGRTWGEPVEVELKGFAATHRVWPA